MIKFSTPKFVIFDRKFEILIKNLNLARDKNLFEVNEYSHYQSYRALERIFLTKMPVFNGFLLKNIIFFRFVKMVTWSRDSFF